MFKQMAVLAFALAALCVVGAIILTAIGKTVPTDLWTLAFASLTGGAGIAIPTLPTTPTVTTTTPTTATTYTAPTPNA